MSSIALVKDDEDGEINPDKNENVEEIDPIKEETGLEIEENVDSILVKENEKVYN